MLLGIISLLIKYFFLDFWGGPAQRGGPTDWKINQQYLRLIYDIIIIVKNYFFTYMPLVTRGISMIHVVVEFAFYGTQTIVHGPFYSEYGALWYKRRLERYRPESTYLLNYLVPEQNIPK